ncbi:hypothetical protein Mgra_00008285 [Meloidogyne graminicola]|uniref:Uncharacterized protein n=1 Tax=Meloidogyne graminicola TaxID=189291 RepID=A0A8S9ZG25_9BILA|nr:hypothetical protein Mgra_00008285 [Meloidogyne graminicola]
MGVYPISAAGNDNEAEPSNKTIYNRAYREKLKEKGENIDKTSFKQIERIYCPTGEEQKKLINYYKDPKFQEARRQREINKKKKVYLKRLKQNYGFHIFEDCLFCMFMEKLRLLYCQ